MIQDPLLTRIIALEKELASLRFSVNATSRPAKPDTKLAVYAITREVAQGYGIREADILGRSRQALISEARQVVMYRAHKAGFSTEQIGRALNRHHTTVMHGIRAEKARRGE